MGHPQQISTGFASSLRYCSDIVHRGGQPNFARCLAVSWAGTLCIHFGGFSDGILPGANCTLRPSLAFSYIGIVTARHSSSKRQRNCGVVQGMELQNFRIGRHLYSAGRPSRWASAHILVYLLLRAGAKYCDERVYMSVSVCLYYSVALARAARAYSARKPMPVANRHIS